MNLPPVPPNPPPCTEPARWFAQEVHPHEASLKSFLHGAFPTVRDVDDVVQESYLRILKMRATQPIQSAKAFLFKVARHVAIDLVRRNKISPINSIGHLEDLAVLEEGHDAAETAARQERIHFLSEAIAKLPTRCRETFILHKIKGFSRKEVAMRLKVSERTVEAQTVRAMKRCTEHLRRQGIKGLYENEAR